MREDSERGEFFLEGEEDELRSGISDRVQGDADGGEATLPYLDKFHNHQVRAGRAGGLARTTAKREATRRNLAKARLSRWKGREAAKEAMAEALRKLKEGIQVGRGQVDGPAREVEEGRNLHDGGASGLQQGVEGDKEEG